MKKQVIVIYYDGIEYQAKTMTTDTPDSSMPFVYGLPDEMEIVAVIASPGKFYTVFIDEQAVLEGENV